MKKVGIILCLFLSSVSLYSQDKNHEVNSEVKELSNFHTVIYKLWHTAWPKKDISMLQSLLPDIEKGTQNIVEVKLPGILREKQTKWENGVAELKVCAAEYKTASEKKDSSAILKAAETLHSQYEKLVRIIRPVIKEVDLFHQELYLVYHYYMPENDVTKLQASAKVLSERVVELQNAKLPKRLESKKDSFDKAVAELTSSVQKLSEVAGSKIETKTLNNAVNLVHSNYQALEKVFD